MKFCLKCLKRLGYFLALAFVGLVIYTQTLLGFEPEWWWGRKFTEAQKPVSHRVEADGRTLHYVDTNELEKPVLLLIHGSPGSWLTFEDYFKDATLRERFRIIAVDRPGFGFSGQGKPERSVLQQAKDIAVVFERIDPATPVIVAGHSYGGPVAAQMAMLYRERVSALMLLAGSSDPDLQFTRSIQLIAKWPIIEWLVPPFAYSTNEEILALQPELERMKSDWENIVAPTVIMHGDADTLVPIGNAEFSARMLTNAASVTTYRQETMDHFIIWNQYPQILQIVFGLLDDIEGKESAG